MSEILLDISREPGVSKIASFGASEKGKRRTPWTRLAAKSRDATSHLSQFRQLAVKLSRLKLRELEVLGLAAENAAGVPSACPKQGGMHGMDVSCTNCRSIGPNSDSVPQVSPQPNMTPAERTLTFHGNQGVMFLPKGTNWRPNPADQTPPKTE